MRNRFEIDEHYTFEIGLPDDGEKVISDEILP